MPACRLNAGRPFGRRVPRALLAWQLTERPRSSYVRLFPKVADRQAGNFSTPRRESRELPPPATDENFISRFPSRTRFPCVYKQRPVFRTHALSTVCLLCPVPSWALGTETWRTGSPHRSPGGRSPRCFLPGPSSLRLGWTCLLRVQGIQPVLHASLLLGSGPSSPSPALLSGDAGSRRTRGRSGQHEPCLTRLWLRPKCAEVPGAGIEPAPQQ